VRDVELALLDPLRPRRIPLEDGLPVLEPIEFLRPLLPPGLEVALGLLVDRGVVCVRLLGELRGRREAVLGLQQDFEVFLLLDGFGLIRHLTLLWTWRSQNK